MIDFNSAVATKHDLQAEMRILGTLIGIGSPYDSVCYEIFTLIDGSFFYNFDTRELFEFLLSYYKRKHSFDYCSISNKVPNKLQTILDEITANGFYFSRNLFSQDIKNLALLKNIRPQLIELNSIITDCARDDVAINCSERISRGIEKISNLHSEVDNNYCETYEEIIEEILSSDDAQTELPINLHTWPSLPFPGMISIAGRPSVGKTYMGIFLMEQIIQVLPDKQALYFNLEMNKKVMLGRHAAIIGQSLPSLKETIKEAAPDLLSRDVKIISRTHLSIEEIELIVRAQSMKKPLSVIVVDYVGLVQSKKKYDREDLKQGDIAQRLAALSLDHKCIVLALLQVNRDHKNKPIGNKCPETTDAAESMGTVKSSEWWLGLDQPQLDEPENELYKDLFIIKNRKSRGKAGYFTIYMEFKNGTFTEIDQNLVKSKLQLVEKDLKPMKAFKSYKK